MAGRQKPWCWQPEGQLETETAVAAVVAFDHNLEGTAIRCSQKAGKARAGFCCLGSNSKSKATERRGLASLAALACEEEDQERLGPQSHKAELGLLQLKQDWWEAGQQLG